MSDPGLPSIEYSLKIEEPAWIRGHYHCKKCGGEIKCWKSFNWQVETGVWRLGGCEKDSLIMIEYDRSDPKWIQI